MDRGMARERERTPHGLGTLVGDARGVERAREPGRRTRAETWVRGSSRTGEARTQSQLVAVLEGRLGILLHGLVVRILAGVVGDDESATNAAGGARRAEGAPRRAGLRDAAPRPASGETRLARASAFCIRDSSAARSAHRKRHRLDARVDPTLSALPNDASASARVVSGGEARRTPRIRHETPVHGENIRVVGESDKDARIFNCQQAAVMTNRKSSKPSDEFREPARSRTKCRMWNDRCRLFREGRSRQPREDRHPRASNEEVWGVRHKPPPGGAPLAPLSLPR